MEGSKRASAPDYHRQAVAARSLVEVLDGVHKGKTGVVAHVHKPYVWLHCRDVVAVRCSPRRDATHVLCLGAGRARPLAVPGCWPCQAAGRVRLLAVSGCWPCQAAGRARLLAVSGCWPCPAAGRTLLALHSRAPARDTASPRACCRTTATSS